MFALEYQVQELKTLNLGVNNMSTPKINNQALSRQIPSSHENLNRASSRTTNIPTAPSTDWWDENEFVDARTTGSGGTPDLNSYFEGFEEAGDSSETQGLTSQIEELRTQIKQSDRMSSGKKNELLAKLDRAKSALELFKTPSEEQVSNATDLLDETASEFSKLNTTPKAANDLAAHLHLDVSEVMSAAEEAGINLDHLPHPPTKELIEFVRKLNPQLDDNLDQFNSTKEDRAKAITDHYSKADAEDKNWKANSETLPNTSVFKESAEYFFKKDSEFKKMTGLVKDTGNSFADAINALGGYNVKPGTEADQLVIDGTSYYFMDWDTGTTTLSTSAKPLTQKESDFYRAPRNENAGTVFIGSDDYSKIERAWRAVNEVGTGYPGTDGYGNYVYSEG